MENLLLIGIVLLIVLIILIVAIAIVIFKLLMDLRYLVNLAHLEADKLVVEAANMRSKIARRSNWLGLFMSLIGQRQVIKKLADSFTSTRKK